MMETSQNLPFLFAAFAVAWVVFLAYAGYMSWKRQTLEREVQELTEMAAESAPDESGMDESGTAASASDDNRPAGDDGRPAAGDAG